MRLELLSTSMAQGGESSTSIDDIIKASLAPSGPARLYRTFLTHVPAGRGQCFSRLSP